MKYPYEKKCKIDKCNNIIVMIFTWTSNLCKSCQNKDNSTRQRKPWSDIENIFKINDCILLSKKEDYINKMSIMEFQCSCGNIHKKTISVFKSAPRCKNCSNTIHSKNGRYSKPTLLKIYIDHKCILLNYDQYINIKSILKFECSCGNIGEKTLEAFKDTPMCKICSNTKSVPEITIERILYGMNINFQTQYRFNDCRNILPLPFDFAIFTTENILQLLIEYNGPQHYKEKLDKWNWDKEKLDKRKKLDKIKKEYCVNNNIPLLVIPYTEEHNLQHIILDNLS